MKILLYCPLYPTRPRIFARTLQSIFTQDYAEPVEMVFGKHDHDPKNDGGDDLMEKHNRIRDWVLQGGYDALFSVEADIILPFDALSRLTAVDADVAYGVYCFRRGSHPWSAYTLLSGHSGKSIQRNRRWCAEVWGQVIETKGVGMGCTLIRRNVLETIEFRRNGSAADDWYFALDCQEHGFRQKHDLGVVCGHIVREPSPHIIWPSITHPERMYEVEDMQ